MYSNFEKSKIINSIIEKSKIIDSIIESYKSPIYIYITRTNQQT